MLLGEVINKMIPLEIWSRIMNYLIGTPTIITSMNDINYFIGRIRMMNELKSCDRFRARRDVMTITEAVMRYCNRFPLWLMKSNLIRNEYKNIIHHKQRRYHYFQKRKHMYTFDDVYMFYSNGITYVSVWHAFD